MKWIHELIDAYNTLNNEMEIQFMNFNIATSSSVYDKFAIHFVYRKLESTNQFISRRKVLKQTHQIESVKTTSI